MKTFNIALVTAALMTVAAPAFAGEADTPSYQEQATNQWIATGDANYARAAGLSAQQAQEAVRLPLEHHDFD
jgi:hypothetical protein